MMMRLSKAAIERHKRGCRAHYSGQARSTTTPTDAGRETLRAYRAALAAESPGDWRVVHRMFGPPWYVRRVRAGAGGEDRQPGAYYTPPEILAIIDPCMGSGAFLAELAQNPPWGES